MISLLCTISFWNNLLSRYLKKANLWFIIYPVFPYKLTTLQGFETKFLAGYLWQGNIKRERKRERKRGCASFTAQRESRLFVCLPLLVSVIKVFASLFHWAIVEVGKKLGEVSLQFDSSKTETGISDALSFSEISLACQCL